MKYLELQVVPTWSNRAAQELKTGFSHHPENPPTSDPQRSPVSQGSSWVGGPVLSAEFPGCPLVSHLLSARQRNSYQSLPPAKGLV